MFEPIQSGLNLNPLPIVLIDVSGSTETDFQVGMTVRCYEFKLAEDICRSLGYNEVNIITWSTTAEMFPHVPIDHVKQIKDKTTSSGGTQLECGLKCINDELFQNGKTTDIIILTDGEVDDSKVELLECFTKLIPHSIRIRIIAVEPNDNDYSDAKISVGNRLYKIIKDGKMTRIVERFSIYNRREVEFVNMFNPTVITGYLPYGDKMFKISDFSQFVQHVKNEILDTLTTNSETMRILLIQKLSLTVYHYTKDKPYRNKILVIDLFTNLLKDTPYYSQFRSILLDEVNNHMIGKSSTYAELRKMRYTQAENNVVELLNDTFAATSTTHHNYQYTFIMSDHQCNTYTIKTYDRVYDDLKQGCHIYKNSSVSVGDYNIPIMFNFDQTTCALALQWIKQIYSQRLNVSVSSDYLYYYVMCDAFQVRDTELSTLYTKYINLLLNDFKYGTETSHLQEMINSNMINIPYNVVAEAVQYTGLTIQPLTLYYIICNMYLLPHIMDKSLVLDSLRKYCHNQIMTDITCQDNWQIIDSQLSHIIQPKLQVINITHEKINILQNHHYVGDIDCPSNTSVLNSNGEICCELCRSVVESITIQPNTEFSNIGNIRPHYLNKHTHLGYLDGVPINQLIRPTSYKTEYTSFSTDNTMIVDPISNSRLKIMDETEFNHVVTTKYPFLSRIKWDNIALCGGFARAVLLKQQMKDFDFFFYGLCDDSNYMNRVKVLAEDLMRSLKQDNDTYKFAVLYKPLFNVIELICYEDPKNHIKEDFTLDYFDKYKFKTMRKYKSKNNGKHDKPIEMKYYFEDNDEHGVKMKYRLQLVMCQYDSILDIFKSFDMFPSMVGYDGAHVYFTPKSLMSYQFMINEININGGTDMAKHRINKYFKYGFTIVLPNSSRNWKATDFENNYSQEHIKYHGTNENLGPLKFKVRYVTNNTIYINHNSNYDGLTERNVSLEKKAKKKGVALYTSSLFCSFVSVLRYVKINNICYRFPLGQEIYDVFEDKSIKLSKVVPITFFTKQKSIYPTSEWYDGFVKSIIMCKYLP